MMTISEQICLQYRDEVAELKAHITTLERENAGLRNVWRPISEAPKDGTLILGWDNKIMRGRGAACVMGWFRNETTQKHEWMNFWNAYRVDGPSHWQPLPLPPAPNQEG